MPAGIITPAISAFSASTRKVPSSTRSRSAAARRTTRRSAPSSAPASGRKPCRKPSTPSSTLISPSGVTGRHSSTPGGGWGRSRSRRPFMALLDLATGSLVADPAEVATLLEPTADAGALADAAGGNAGPIAIRFPTFGDGRGISLAVLLRERHGSKGEIRAVGYLIPDLAQFLLRSGFDTAEIADPAQASVWKASVSRIQHNYQRGYRNPLPLRREASHKEAEALDQRLVRVKS